MNDFFTAARHICNPLASPNWPTTPPETEAERKGEWMDRRREEVFQSDEQLDEALYAFLESNPGELSKAIRKSTGGTLVAAIELDEVVVNAINAYLEKEWAK